MIIRMAAEIFPGGFRLKLEGAPVTRKTEWTFDRKIELLDIMRGCLDKGMTESQAAEEYRKYHKATYNRMLGLRGITNRFHEFKAWESGSLTAQEELEFLKRMHRQREDLTALTERLERARPH